MMLRRSCGTAILTAATTASTSPRCSARCIASEFKDIRPRSGGAAPPPSISNNEPILPMDFNPHIEWFEYPKEIFDPKFPYTREESIRMTEESWESTMDEMASKYGMRLNMSSKPTFWMAWFIMFFYSWYTLWGCYRAMGTEPGWSHFKNVVLNHPTVPVLEEDDIYLDQWMRPEMREKFSRYDRFWNWKPLVKRDGAKTTWSIPMQYADESEWRHMTSRF
ncbi:conserved hypothetical protein [Leishmania major strain Friedlin]|uniref:Uncharacterized protein n=1 Tax=Leishmania major TaxID=5664 RepID=Q4QID2_LEIMA|nr:conserved hypothetical protein [Leishmania major strain Friedlin]CAG9569335.1 hypothetical_protein_-_conserved [Leishmania major strain Friedlin]CAJ02216.1 conserved hypothetical protein [Leishmania major strain Friedlin]|eukprot:XP_001681066.1 conserved hypothetical protein [Leishmania major strain Friedlin]